MSDTENEASAAEETPAEEDVEPTSEVVPEDYLDQKPFDPAGR
jgi:hypothetical protein